MILIITKCYLINQLLKELGSPIHLQSIEFIVLSVNYLEQLKGKTNYLSREGTNDWQHISTRLNEHESSIDHLNSVIRYSMYVKNNRVDVNDLRLTSNTKVAENRETVKVIIEIIIYLARQNIPFRGHDESVNSLNRGNFLQLDKLLFHHHPILSHHMAKIDNSIKKNRLTFLSNVSQNTLTHILGEIVWKNILTSVAKAGKFSVIIDTTIDVACLEQFSMILRFVMKVVTLKKDSYHFYHTRDY